MDNNAKELVKRSGRLFGRKQALDSLCQEIALQFYPERADFTEDRTLGDEFASHLFDGSPVMARRDLGNAFSSMLRPRGQPWFKARIGDDDLMEDQNVASFMDKIVTHRMRLAMYRAKSQFIRATKEADHDFAAFGNAILSVEPNRALDGLLYRCWHFRDCAWAEDAEGAVDTLFRTVPKMSARQIRQAFPKAKLHRDIERALDKDPDKEFKIQHVMMPAADYEFSGPKPAGKQAYASVYIDCDHQELLSEAGAYEFRYVVPRWQTLAGSPYAASPAAMVSLGDARMIQVMARVIMEAGEKSVDPPMKATEEAVRGGINLYAGGITWVDKGYDERLGLALEPIPLGKNVSLGVDMLDRTRMIIQEAWYLNKLTLPSQAKTAYETQQLVQEFIRAAIPLFEPMETNYNAPLLDMTASIMVRMGAFGNPEDMPETLRGADIEFEFSNPLQDAIEKNKYNQALMAVEATVALAQLDQKAINNLDVQRIHRDAVSGIGAPADWLKSEDDVEASNEQAGEMEQMQQVLAGAESATGSMDKAAAANLKLVQAEAANATA